MKGQQKILSVKIILIHICYSKRISYQEYIFSIALPKRLTRSGENLIMLLVNTEQWRRKHLESGWVNRKP